jgi:hypothetical protein
MPGNSGKWLDVLCAAIGALEMAEHTSFIFCGVARFVAIVHGRSIFQPFHGVAVLDFLPSHAADVA